MDKFLRLKLKKRKINRVIWGILILGTLWFLIGEAFALKIFFSLERFFLLVTVGLIITAGLGMNLFVERWMYREEIERLERVRGLLTEEESAGVDVYMEHLLEKFRVSRVMCSRCVISERRVYSWADNDKIKVYSIQDIEHVYVEKGDLYIEMKYGGPREAAGNYFYVRGQRCPIKDLNQDLCEEIIKRIYRIRAKEKQIK